MPLLLSWVWVMWQLVATCCCVANLDVNECAWPHFLLLATEQSLQLQCHLPELRPFCLFFLFFCPSMLFSSSSSSSEVKQQLRKDALEMGRLYGRAAFCLCQLTSPVNGLYVWGWWWVGFCLCVFLVAKWHLLTNNKKAQELSAQGQRITANWRNKEIKEKVGSHHQLKEMHKGKKKYFWCWILRPGAKAC